MRLPIRQHWVLAAALGASGTNVSNPARADVIRDGHHSIQVNVDSFGRNMLGDAANEPSIAVDPGDPRRMAIGWRQFNTLQSEREAGWGYSRDGGHHWTFPGTLTPGVFGSDPVLDVTAEGVFFYVSINWDELRLFRSLDGGVTWEDPYYSLPGLHDKPWIAIDRTGGPGHGHIYLIHGPGGFQRSIDGGATFCREMNAPAPYGVMTVGPNGIVFTGSGRSLNAQYGDETPVFDYLGTRWSIGVPMQSWLSGGLRWQHWIAADQSRTNSRGYIYSLRLVQDRTWQYPSILVVERSRDDGLSWDAPASVADPGLHVQWESIWFPMLSVASNGRLDVVWNDMRHDQTRTYSELYYSYSVDAGETWSTNVPLSPPFSHLVGYPWLSPKLGDYYTMVSDNLGVNIAYAATFNGEQDVYFLRVGPWDCNGNDTPDEQDIASGWSHDININDIPDDCEVPQDADGNGRVNLFDYAAWQNCRGWTDSRFAGHRAGGGRSGVVVLSPGKGDAAGANPLCPRFDADANGHADLDDFVVFHEEFTRPQGPE